MNRFPYMDMNDINLDWLLHNMKVIIKEWAEYQVSINNKFDSLAEAYEDLKEWINDFFRNLNVQTEINNKLDEMRDNGELATILTPIIAGDVSTWLAAHITQPTTPAVDSSLLVSGAAADSATVGTEIDRTRKALNVYMPASTGRDMLPGRWVVAHLDAQGQLAWNMNSRASTMNYLKSETAFTLYFETMLSYALCLYDENYVLTERTTGKVHDLAIPANTWFRLTVYQSAGQIANAYTVAQYVRMESGLDILQADVSQIEGALNQFSAENALFPELADDWTIGGLDLDGTITESYTGRVSNRFYHVADYDLHLISTVRMRVVLCTYDAAHTLLTREYVGNLYEMMIPANTIFRLTLYTEEAAISDALAFGSVMRYIPGNAAAVVAGSGAVATGGRMPLPSAFAIGHLNEYGFYVAGTARLTFVNYMSFPFAVTIIPDSNVNSILCTYDSNFALVSRTLNGLATPVYIPAGTIFRLTIYQSGAETPDDPATYAQKVGLYVNQINPSDYNVISIFESFAVIGDSLSCGFVSSGAGQSISSNTAREAGRNWPTYLGLTIDRPFTNLARGSSTAHDWRYGSVSLDVDINTADIDTYCYMIAIGVNDARQALPVGAETDIATDYNNNADTFYGNFDFLVRKLHAFSSARIAQAQIFVMTMPPTETNAESYNDAIRAIAAKYSYVHCIDLYRLYNDTYSRPPLTNLWIGGHSRPLGYAIAADMIRRAVNNYMLTYPARFNYTPWAPL